MINITYQGSQVQPQTTHSSQERKISQSQYQAHSNIGGSFIKVVPHGPTPIIQPYIQGPIPQQGRISINNQVLPIQGQGMHMIQPRPNFGVLNQSQGGNVIIANQTTPRRVVTGSFHSGPQILRN